MKSYTKMKVVLHNNVLVMYVCHPKAMLTHQESMQILTNF
jgi:hypothetical protein